MVKMTEVRKIAKRWGIKTVRLSKGDVIRKIQTAEGNYPCFETAKGECEQKGCLWYDDCVNKDASECGTKDT